MNFELSTELLQLQDRTRTFIRERILPMEADPRQDSHGPPRPCARSWSGWPARPAC